MYVIMCNLCLFKDFMASFSVIAEDLTQPYKRSVPSLHS